MSGSLEQFLTDLSRGLERTMVAVNKELTLRQRIKRTWSMRQCARFLNVSIQYLTKFANSSDDFPAGEYVGRERVFTLFRIDAHAGPSGSLGKAAVRLPGLAEA